MTLLIDNYDSFTYNLYQYIGIFTKDIAVVRNDQITIDQIRQMAPDRIILSPGPKAPKDAGICLEVIKTFYRQIPILGICLGHQCIGEAFGARVSYAEEICHGKQSKVYHDQKDVFAGIDSPVAAARYHSLSIQKETLPAQLEVTAQTQNGEIMGVRVKGYPVYGLQFHPESIYTDHGKRMIENFLQMSGKETSEESEERKEETA